jgi:pyrroline-5-carboxylate reductase
LEKEFLEKGDKMPLINRVGFVGAGHMATQIIKGLLKDNKFLPENVWASDPSQKHLEVLSKEYGIVTTSSNTDLFNQVDLLVLSVKPQSFSDVAASLQTIKSARCVGVMSVMAGVTVSQIKAHFAGDLPVIRTMPNLPSRVGLGCTGLFASKETPDVLQLEVQAIMDCVGKTLWMSHEDQLNVVAAISGSGPAYFFLMMEALENAACAQGLPLTQAQMLVKQTALGACVLASESDVELATLREQVTSKGGTTAAALAVFEEKGIKNSFLEAVQAAIIRARELSKMIDAP